MAQALQFICDTCGKAVEAWDEGNPYYLNEAGKKRYAYHPDKDRERCTGNDWPHLCLSCGEEFMVDSESPIVGCPHCSSALISDTYDLDGKQCPYCKRGSFKRNSDFFCIS